MVQCEARFIVNRNRRWVFAALCSPLMPLTGQLQRPKVIILIGPPGSGKTLQAGLLSKRFKVPAISMPQLLGQEVGSKTPMGEALAASVTSGELVADGPANELMNARLLRPDASRGFVLDGYPVSEGQAKALDQFLSEHGFPKPAVIVIDAPEDVLRRRLKQRGRADDRQAGNIDRRIAEYQQIGRLVENWYGRENCIHVDGQGTAADVARRISVAIESAEETKTLKRRQ